MDRMLNHVLLDFFDRAKEDCRLGTTHISLFTVLVYLSLKKGEHPVYFFGQELMDLAKVSRRTYHPCMQDLQRGGYIKYVPSYNPALGSLVYLTGK